MGFCQTGRLTGIVKDAETKIPLELATVSVYNLDSSLITYRLSDKNGQFTIEKLPTNKKLLIGVTYTGYIGQHRTVQLDAAKRDTLSIYLALKNNDSAVVITTSVPVRMNGDTLEINPAAFKLKEHAVVEELLNKVSGITIWSDGTITVNGRTVKNLLVDGKPFLGSSDSRIATQNLPKSAIDKIQVYQEYDRSNIGQESRPQDSLLTMNIKLKEKSKKGYFGKAGAGYGTSDRFESDLFLQTYTKRSSAGFGAGFNNTNKNIGNLQEMFQNNTYRNLNPNLYNVGRFGSNGVNRSHSFGGVFTHNFIENTNSRQSNRVEINYNKSGSDLYLTDLNLQNRVALVYPQLVRDEGVQNNIQNRHELGINFVKSNSYNDHLNVNSQVGFNNESGNSSRYTEVRDTADQLINTNKIITLQSGKSDYQSLGGNFGRSDFENPIRGFTVLFNLRRYNTTSERDVESIFQSFTNAAKDTAYNRHYSGENHSFNVGGSLDYSGFKRLLLGRFNLFGINLNFTQGINYARTEDISGVSDYDSTSKQFTSNSKLSNQNKRELFEYIPGLAFTKNYYRYSSGYSRNFTMQVKFLNEMKSEKNQSSFEIRDLDRSFHFFRYEGNLSYYYQKREKYQANLSVYYSKNYEYPNIDQLFTIVDDLNVYNIRFGNPFLKNRTNHNFNLNTNFNTDNRKSVYSVNGTIGGNYSIALHPVTDSIINELSGKRIYYFTNADKSSNLSLRFNFNISRKLDKDNLQFMYSGQYGAGRVPNFIDGIYNRSESGNLFNQFSVQYSIRTLMIITIGQNFQRYQSRQTDARFSSFTNRSNNTRVGLVLNYPENFSFSSTADHIANQNLDEPTFLWNAFATWRIMKQQGELKFSAMDLLKQYQNIINSANAYGTTTRITNGLQQYFLLTFSYFPRKFGKTEIKKQASQS